MDDGFTHLDAQGAARMVDVTAKAVTARRARATCRVRVGEGRSIDRAVLEEARLAAVQAVKRVGSLIPLCHPLPIDASIVEIVAHDAVVDVAVSVTTTARTGVEMEALTACAVAALCIVAASGASAACIEWLELVEKQGGRSGAWRRETPSANAATLGG